MARKNVVYTLRAALKEAQAAGLNVAGYEIEPESGKIIVKIGKQEDSPKADLDQWMAKHARPS